jgi:hypothetical protein
MADVANNVRYWVRSGLHGCRRGFQFDIKVVGNKGGGRLTFYKKKFAEQAAMACDAGFMDRELADLFGVCETTIKYVDS